VLLGNVFDGDASRTGQFGEGAVAHHVAAGPPNDAVDLRKTKSWREEAIME
jgi:hypothetical protein